MKRECGNDGYRRIKGDDANAFVYFIGEPNGVGPVKIGYSAWPRKRLSMLQVSSPVELVILAKVWCLSQWEKEMHEVFKDSRIRGEWFRRTPKLMRVINAAAHKDFGQVVNILYEDYEPTAEDAIAGADQFFLITEEGRVVEERVHGKPSRRHQMRESLRKATLNEESRLNDVWTEPD